MSSFDLAMRFMPPARRKALRALYDFCRVVDDAVDHAGDEAAARAAVLFWRQEVGRVFDGVPMHRATTDLQAVVKEYGLARVHLDDLLAGFETDCCNPLAMKDWAELERYCYRVAGCVGLLALPIFGTQTQAAKEFAVTLGHALQLTNILRDLQEDQQRGRNYLPVGVTAEQLAERAAMHFKRAYEQAPRERGLLPAFLMRDAYYGLFRKMRRGGNYARRDYPVRLGLLDKAQLVMKAVKYGLSF